MTPKTAVTSDPATLAQIVDAAARDDEAGVSARNLARDIVERLNDAATAGDLDAPRMRLLADVADRVPLPDVARRAVQILAKDLDAKRQALADGRRTV